MNEVESSPAVSRKKRSITLWPSIVMLSLLLGSWVFFYNDVALIFFAFGLNLFAAVCLICFLYQMVRLRPKKSAYFLIPVLLLASTGFMLIPRVAAMWPIRKSFFYSRDYVEFLVYDARHHIEAEVRQNGYRYKEWHLPKHSGTYYQIVYDVTDATARRDGIEGGGCTDWVTWVGGYFYFVRVECPGIL
jgi:hypothetical protein